MGFVKADRGALFAMTLADLVRAAPSLVLAEL
jgi:hypothetical protein